MNHLNSYTKIMKLYNFLNLNIQFQWRNDFHLFPFPKAYKHSKAFKDTFKPKRKKHPKAFKDTFKPKRKKVKNRGAELRKVAYFKNEKRYSTTNCGCSTSFRDFSHMTWYKSFTFVTNFPSIANNRLYM